MITVTKKQNQELFEALYWVTGATRTKKTNLEKAYSSDFIKSIFLHQDPNDENTIRLVTTDGKRLHQQNVSKSLITDLRLQDLITTSIYVSDWKAYVVTKRTKSLITIDPAKDCFMPGYEKVIPDLDKKDWFIADSIHWNIYGSAISEEGAERMFPTIIAHFCFQNNLKVPVIDPNYIDSDMISFDFIALHKTNANKQPLYIAEYYPGKYGKIKRFALIMPRNYPDMVQSHDTEGEETAS